ncbi:hypothetical protein [Streptomyces sp. NPDC093598]|uniref:hypothetical protein n=1 Tax=Streptomyces sp. NPDC093598 TaxID=3366046 RepID=UPI0037F49785
MAADQLPAEVGEFATYLDGLLKRLDPSGGWCAVFWQRDPEGMRAALDGREMPPWDVVEALLRDLAGQYGPGGAGPETDRARSLHAAALAAYDTRPGGRDALGDRLDVMLREQKYAAERQAALARRLASATAREEADALRLDLAWARDDHERAVARCAELRARMTYVDRRDRGVSPRAWTDGDASHGAGAGSSAAGTPAGPPPAVTGPSGRRDMRYGAADPEAGRPAPQRPESRTALGEAVAGAGPEAFSAPAGRYGARDGAAGPGAGWLAPEHPAGRTAPGEAVALTQPDAFSAPAGRYGTREGGAADPEAGRHARQLPTSRTAPEGAVAAATPDAFIAAVGTGAGWHAPEHPASRRAPGGASDGLTTPAAPVSAAFTGAAPATAPAAPEPPTPKQRKRRRGSARFAGMVAEEAAAVAVPPGAVPPGAEPTVPAPDPTTTGRGPRGARFAGVAEEVVAERPMREDGVVGAADLAEVGRTVDVLARLRREGRSGEAHALLAEVASWAPGRFPLLAERLQHAGLDADWQTLLWEAASLPAGRLVAAADALVAAGRAGDGRQMLRQGVARPPGELGRAVLGLVDEGRHREVRVLLDAYVRARTPEEAARSAEPDPRRLVPLLLEAARGVSDERGWDLVHALRVAGFAA